MKTTKIARLVALSAVFVVAASLSIGNVHASQPVVTSVDVPLCAKASNEVHCYAVEHRFFVNGVAEKNYSQLQTDLSKMGFTLDQIQSSSTPAVNLPALTAVQLRKIYGDAFGTGSTSATLTGNLIKTATIAIIDVWDPAYSVAQTISDFNAYKNSTRYGNGTGNIPNSTTQGALNIYDQNGNVLTASSPAPCGGSCYPSDWGGETALDIDMVNAICPTCTVDLFLANSPTFSDLGAAVTAASNVTGVVAMSNSYGNGDGTPYDGAPGTSYPAWSNAALKGIAVTASSDDNGYGNSDPADFTNVIGVGGTGLATVNSAAGQSIWVGAGSGCSPTNRAPYQTGTSCSGKAVSDISAVANPNTGVAVSFNNAWYQYGGTSVSSPIIATYFGMFSNLWSTARPTGSSSGYAKAPYWLWTLPSRAFSDVTLGEAFTGTARFGRSTTTVMTNANPGYNCSTSVWCKVGSGWDGPTGRGTPIPGVAGTVF